MPLTITATANEQDRHLRDVYTVLFHNDKLFTGAEDGKVKVWGPDLKHETEFQAHQSVVYHLAAYKNTLYSCSNDGTIQAWDIDTLKHKKTLLQYNDEVSRLYVVDGVLYSGDDKGIFTAWKDDSLVRQFNFVEEIRDFKVLDNFVYAVRDRDMCVHEILTGNKGKYTTRVALDGCSPVTIIGNKICFAARNPSDICIHENHKESTFKQLAVLKGHEMIVNAIVGWGDSTMFSAGYDGKVKEWDLNTMQCVNTCEIGSCINALSVGSQGQVYAAGVNGFLHRLENK